MVGCFVFTSAFYRIIEKKIKIRKGNHHDLLLGIKRKEKEFYKG